MNIVKTVDSYYTNSSSDVPIVFEVTPSDSDLNKDSLKDVDFKLQIPSLKTHELIVFSDRIAEGDLINDGGVSSDKNYFTAVINKNYLKTFDDLNENKGCSSEGDITTCASFNLSAKVETASGTHNIQAKKDIDRFGDDTIPIYEIGVDDKGENGVYKMKYSKPAQLEKVIYNRNTGNEIDFLEGDFWSYTNSRNAHLIYEGEFYRNRIEFSTADMHPYNNEKLRVSAVDERRQAYFLIYYGRKKVSIKGDNFNIIDIKDHTSNIKIDAFKNVENNHYYTYQWSSIDKKSSISETLMYSLSVASTAVSLVGAANLWNPAGWAALSAGEALKMATTLAGVVTLAASDIPSRGDWAKVTLLGALSIRKKDGSKEEAYIWPSDNPEQIEKRIPYDLPGEDCYEDCVKHNNWNFSTQGLGVRVKVGQTVTLYTSGSIQAGTLTGLGGYLWLQLKYDVREDPNVYVTE